MDLNEKQKEAVEILDGPVLIIAGAGAGKTKTLTARIGRLIERGVAPENILAITFTNKAAEEMRRRIMSYESRMKGKKSVIYNSPPKADSSSAKKFAIQNFPFIGTFHSFCVRILRTEAEALGYKKSFVIYDEDDQTALVKLLMRDLEIDPKQISPPAVLNRISWAKSELVGPGEFAGAEGGGYLKNVAVKIYPVYQAALASANAFDFDDLIMKTVELFKKNPDILEKYQNIFRYILVDEYQDTNFAQYVLIKLLARKYRNLCVVGDDWQCVYSWRNADFRNILNFEKDYPEALVVKLEQNYRSTKNILDCAGAVIAENNFRTEKKLWTENPGGAKLKIAAVANEKKEGEYAVSEIRRLKKEENLRLSDFAVLYRTNAQSRALEEAFLKAGVPYKIIGGIKFYLRKEIKDVLAYVRFVLNPSDLVSLQRIFNSPPRGFGEFLPQNTDFLKEAKERAPKKLPGAEKLNEFFERTRELLKKVPPGEFVKILVKESGYEKWINDGTVLGEARLENVKELVNVASSHGTIEKFLENAALVSESDNLDFTKDKVNLMTLHLAKGLEFPVVFIAGVEEGLLPHSKVFAGGASELEEERRLCYVGMTRAKKFLYLLFSRRRFSFFSAPSTVGGFGRTAGRRESVPSRFLASIPEDLIEFVDDGEEYIEF